MASVPYSSYSYLFLFLLFLSLRWSAGWSNACRAIECLFNHGLEARIAEDSLLSQVLPDGMQLRGIDRLVQPTAIGGGTGSTVASQGVENRMGREQRIDLLAEMGVDARPGMFLRGGDHRGANRVELDVAVDRQEVSIGIDKAGFEAPFPQRPGTTVAAVEGLHVALPMDSQRPRNRSGMRCAGQQVDMVSHQHVGMQRHAVLVQGCAEQCQVMVAVVIVNEDRHAIHAALGDVQWNAWHLQAGATGHVGGRRAVDDVDRCSDQAPATSEYGATCCRGTPRDVTPSVPFDRSPLTAL